MPISYALAEMEISNAILLNEIKAISFSISLILFIRFMKESGMESLFVSSNSAMHAKGICIMRWLIQIGLEQECYGA